MRALSRLEGSFYNARDEISKIEFANGAMERLDLAKTMLQEGVSSFNGHIVSEAISDIVGLPKSVPPKFGVGVVNRLHSQVAAVRSGILEMLKIAAPQNFPGNPENAAAWGKFRANYEAIAAAGGNANLFEQNEQALRQSAMVNAGLDRFVNPLLARGLTWNTDEFNAAKKKADAEMSAYFGAHAEKLGLEADDMVIEARRQMNQRLVGVVSTKKKDGADSDIARAAFGLWGKQFSDGVIQFQKNLWENEGMASQQITDFGAPPPWEYLTTATKNEAADLWADRVGQSIALGAQFDEKAALQSFLKGASATDRGYYEQKIGDKSTGLIALRAAKYNRMFSQVDEITEQFGGALTPSFEGDVVKFAPAEELVGEEGLTKSGESLFANFATHLRTMSRDSQRGIVGQLERGLPMGIRGPIVGAINGALLKETGNTTDTRNLLATFGIDDVSARRDE